MVKTKTKTPAVKGKVHGVARDKDTIAEERLWRYRKRVTWLKDRGDTGKKILLQGLDTEDSDNVE